MAVLVTETYSVEFSVARKSDEDTAGVLSNDHMKDLNEIIEAWVAEKLPGGVVEINIVTD